MITDSNRKPSADQATSNEIITATLAMGCFWSPDALFGSLEGVVRTRVGYAGGSTPNPTYRNLADHIETVQIDYDPARLSYQDLLNVFFHHHKPIGKPWKRQYMSAVFYHNDEQKQLAEQTKERMEGGLSREIYTAVYPYETFWLAEDRHQKYKLQRNPALIDEFKVMYPDFSDLINSTAAARVNGYLYGYGKRAALEENIGSFSLSAAGREVLLKEAIALKEVYGDSPHKFTSGRVQS